MNCLLVSVCMLVLVSVEAHLQRFTHLTPFPGLALPSSVPWGPPLPQIPGGTPLNAGLWTDPNTFNGGINHGIAPQGAFNIGRWPQNVGTQNVWNNGVSPFGANRGVFNNNVRPSNDPWEQYRKFTSGLAANQGQQTNQVSTNIVPANQIASGGVSNNYPWNTFATQSFNPNGPFVSNNFNQGFVPPQMQSNFNPALSNNQFQNQAFANTFPRQNGIFK